MSLFLISQGVFLKNNNNAYYANHNTYKSDVFSFGLCLLYAASLSEDIIYDIRNQTDFNQRGTFGIQRNSANPEGNSLQNAPHKVSSFP